MTLSPLTRLSNASKQQGGMLIESLIGVLIMAIIGGGIMHVTARMLNTQHDVAVTNVAINELRPLIMSRTNVCDSTTNTNLTNTKIDIPGAGQQTVTIANCELKPITINGVTVQAPQPVILSIDNSSDGSGLIRIGGTSNTSSPSSTGGTP